MKPLRTIAMLGLVAFASLAAARPAAAGDVAASEALFAEGQRLFAAGQVHQACEKFAEAFNQDQTAIGALINLARCHEKEGKTASAWGEYKQVEVLASRSNQKEREQYAHDEAAKLEPSLHKLNLNVKFPIEGIEITRNGVPVGRGQWGTEMPVDPGDVVLKAVAPTKKDWTLTVHLAAGPGVDHFDIPKLEEAPVDTRGGTKETVVVTSNGLGTGKIVGLILAGAGVVAAGIGVTTQLIALQQDSNSKDAALITASTAEIKADPTDCGATPPDATKCPKTHQKYTDHQAAVSDQTIAGVLMAGGGALVIAGLVVFFTSNPAETTKKTEKATWQVVPTFSPSQGGLAVVGTF